MMKDENKSKARLIEELQALRESEARYRGVVEDMPVLICCFLPGGEITFVNKAYCEYFARTPEELAGSNFLTLIPESDRETVMANISALTVESPRQSHEHRVIEPGCDIRWQRWTNRVLFDDQGKAVAYQSIGEDVTERKLVDEALRESEKKFKEMANLLPQIVYEIDIQGNLIFVNKQAFNFFGYSQEEFEKGINVMQTLIPEDRDRAKGNIQNILYGKDIGTPEYTALRKDGSTFPILIYSSAILKDNRPVGLRGIIVDVTDRKLAEEALHESEARFRELLENVSTVAVQGYNAAGIIHYWNKANELIYGYTAEEAIGKSFVELIIPQDMRENVQKIIKHGADAGEMPPAAEITLMRKDGKPVTVFSSHVVVQQSGKEPELFCINVDLTKRKRAEEELQKKMNELEIFYRATLGREERVIELKQEVNDLLEQLGKNRKYRDNSL